MGSGGYHGGFSLSDGITLIKAVVFIVVLSISLYKISKKIGWIK